MKNRFKPPPTPSQVIFYWPFQGGASAVVYYISHCISLHVCLGKILFWIAVWPFLAFCL